MKNNFNIKLGALVDQKILKTNIESFFSKNTFKIKLDIDKSSLSSKLKSGGTYSSGESVKEQVKAQSSIQKALEKTILLRRKDEKAAEKAQAAAINKNIDKQYKEQQRLIDANTKSVTKLSNAIKVYADQGKISKIETSEFTQRLKEIESKGLAPLEKSKALDQLNMDLRTAADTTGLLGQSFGKAMIKYVTWLGIATMVSAIVNTIKQMVQEVINLDKAMVELNKVFDGSESELKKVKDRAFELADAMGRTGEEVINATTEFKRMGYSIDESLDLAKVAVTMTNVAEGITDTGEAANILIAILKGTNTEVEYANSLLDRLNEISNNNAVSFDALANMTKESAATMKILGNNLDQTMGLLTGAYEVLQDESVAKGIQTIGLRIAGLNEDMEAQAGLSNQVVEALQKYAGISAFDEQTGDLKSTYQILEELAGVWDKIDKNQQSALLNTLAGKHQADVAASILNNWEGVASAVEDAANSFGSSREEQEKYYDSIEGRATRIKNLLQEFAEQVIGSDLVKTVLKLVEALVKIVGPLFDIVSLVFEFTGVYNRLEGIATLLSIVGDAFVALDNILQDFAETARPVLDFFNDIGGGWLTKIYESDQKAKRDAEYASQQTKDLAETYGEAEESLSDYEKALRGFRKTMSDFVATQQDELEAIKEQQEALEKQKEIKDKLLDIEKKRLVLEETRQNKVRVYRAGVGFVYQEDAQEVQTAQQELQDAINSLSELQYEIALEEAEQFLEELNELLTSEDFTMEAWNELFGNYESLLDTEFSSYLEQAKKFVTEFNNEISKMEKPQPSEDNEDENIVFSPGRDYSTYKESLWSKLKRYFSIGSSPEEFKSRWDLSQDLAKNASGTTNFAGGDTWVGEHGPELVRLPQGSEILSHNRSMKLHSMVKNPSKYVGAGKSTTLQFNGPLNFPNVRTSADAEGFVQAVINIGNGSMPRLI